MADKKEIKAIGVMTCGGDCPGLNPVVRAITVTAIQKYGWKVLGIEDSMQGLINLDYKSPYGNRWLTLDMVEGIIAEGGSILGCDNSSHPFKYAVTNAEGKKVETDVSDQVIENFKALGLDALVVIGGDGSMAIANRLSKKANGAMPVIGVPKTIDNDLQGTDVTFGFDTASQTITDALDKIRDTARSHDRVMIVEVMGRDAGWLALQSGIAAGAQVVLIPEIEYTVDSIVRKIQERKARGQVFNIIVIAEGAKMKNLGCSMGEHAVGEMPKYAGAANHLQQLLSKRVDCTCRVSVLGYIQRGGSPSNFDRVLGTRLGVKAAELLAEGSYNQLVSLRTPEIIGVDLDEATRGQRLVDPHGSMVSAARQVGICFGDEECAETQ